MPPEETDLPARDYWETPGIFPKPEDEKTPFWGYLDLLLFLGLFAASLALVLLAAGVWAHLRGNGRNELIVIALPLQFLVYIFVYLCFRVLFKLRYNRRVFYSLGWRKTGHSLLAAGVGGVILAFAISALAQLAKTPKVDTPFDEIVKGPLSMALLAVTAIFVGPLFEEMAFRGFLQPLLSKTFGVAAGVLLTALLFGGLHSSEYKNAWQYVAGITLVGVALGVVRAKTGSIIPGTVMHGCFNAVSVAALVFAKFIPHNK